MGKGRKAARVRVTHADGTTEMRANGSFRPAKAERTQSKKTWYEKYVGTPHFKRLRAKVLERDNWMCTGCGARRADGAILQAHHLTYERVPKREWLTDLTTLCQECHRQVHRAV